MRNPSGQWPPRPPSLSHTWVKRVKPEKGTSWENGIVAQSCSVSEPVMQAGSPGTSGASKQTPSLAEIWFQAERWESCTQLLRRAQGWSGCPGTGWLLLSCWCFSTQSQPLKLFECIFFSGESKIKKKKFFFKWTINIKTSLVAQAVKNLPAIQKTWVQSMGQEDPLEKEMATHFSIPAWRMPWTEEPGGPQSMGSQKVRLTLSLTLVKVNFLVKL